MISDRWINRMMDDKSNRLRWIDRAGIVCPKHGKSESGWNGTFRMRIRMRSKAGILDADLVRWIQGNLWFSLGLDCGSPFGSPGSWGISRPYARISESRLWRSIFIVLLPSTHPVIVVWRLYRKKQKRLRTLKVFLALRHRNTEMYWNLIQMMSQTGVLGRSPREKSVFFNLEITGLCVFFWSWSWDCIADPRFSSNYPTIDDEYFFSLSETCFSLKKKSLWKKVPLCWPLT